LVNIKINILRRTVSKISKYSQTFHLFSIYKNPKVSAASKWLKLRCSIFS